MGHAWEYVKVDSSHILMPQRRERVWGSSSVEAHPDTNEYQLNMKMTMQRLKSPSRFGLDHILRDDIPSQDLPSGECFLHHYEKVKQLCKDRHLSVEKACLDVSTSRRREPEWNHDMLTCIRPSHKIWLVGPNRVADPQETLRAHGVFAEEFANPDSILSMDPKLASEMAGDAFSTSVLIAKILCTMVNANPWKQLAEYTCVTRPGLLHECQQQSAKRQGEAPTGVEEPPSKKRKTAANKKRKTPEPESSGDPGKDKNNQSRGYNKKGSLLTISKKMEILMKFEELKNTSKHPEKDIFFKTSSIALNVLLLLRCRKVFQQLVFQFEASATIQLHQKRTTVLVMVYPYACDI